MSLDNCLNHFISELSPIARLFVIAEIVAIYLYNCSHSLSRRKKIMRNGHIWGILRERKRFECTHLNKKSWQKPQKVNARVCRSKVFCLFDFWCLLLLFCYAFGVEAECPRIVWPVCAVTQKQHYYESMCACFCCEFHAFLPSNSLIWLSTLNK